MAAVSSVFPSPTAPAAGMKHRKVNGNEHSSTYDVLYLHLTDTKSVTAYCSYWGLGRSKKPPSEAKRIELLVGVTGKLFWLKLPDPVLLV